MSNVTALASYRRTGFPSTNEEPLGDDVHMQPDGGAIIDLRPEKKRRNVDGDKAFDANLALQMDEGELDYMASQLIDAIDEDDRSRAGWLQAYEKAIDLLGVKIEDAPSQGAQGLMRSSIRAPILLEACIRFQSNARGELLPADGPVKVRIDDTSNEYIRDQAKQLEQDLNHYLTVTATEYYPDFDRMLFHIAFAGCAFRKVYNDPLRGRPVSESVYAPDLIVSQDITDLENANRVTHSITMRQSVMRRMQLLGVYRDIDLVAPARISNSIDAKIKDNMGLAAWADRPEDQPYQVHETYCEWDLKGFEHEDKEGHTGLPLPYQITVERTSRKILAIRRNWREKDPLMRSVPRFIKYGMGSGLGFYDYGFAHILGNSARTLTAIWRLLIDAGMFSNFPGFLMKKGTRQGTTQVRVGPGEAREIESGEDIRQSIMPLPYKEPSQVLMEFAQHIEETARKIAGMAEIEVGEGKQDAPVGTTIALIEQATKVMAAVHKRMHQSQAQELRLLQELFARNPEALWAYSKSPQRKWAAGQEMSNFDLVPASDPNVASQMERVMKVQGLIQLAAGQPGKFNMDEINKRALKALGFDDVEALLLPPQPAGATPPDPKIAVAQLQAQVKREDMQQKSTLQAQKQSADQQLEKMRLAHDFAESIDRKQDRESRERIAAMQHSTALIKGGMDHHADMMGLHQDDQQHQAELGLQDVQHRRELAQSDQQHQAGLENEQFAQFGGVISDHIKHGRQLEHESGQADEDRMAARISEDRQYEAADADRQTQYDMHTEKLDTQSEIAKEAAKAKAKQSKGLGKYARGGRVMPEQPAIHVHPNVFIQQPERRKTERIVEFIFDAQQNVTGARIVEKEMETPDIEVVEVD